eukprot:9193241-Pyramimonas_sp.AAC.1
MDRMRLGEERRCTDGTRQRSQELHSGKGAQSSTWGSTVGTRQPRGGEETHGCADYVSKYPDHPPCVAQAQGVRSR